MKPKLTIHFKMRFGERNVNFDHIKQAIKYPDFKKNEFGGRTKVTKKIDNKIIGVVYYKKVSMSRQEEYVILTVYYNKI